MNIAWKVFFMLTFTFLLINLFQAMPTQSSVASDLAALSVKYKSLRNESSHFDGGEWNPLVDESNSEKKQVMDRLAEMVFLMFMNSWVKMGLHMKR